MPGFGSPCGACKFLRRKCAAGCVFAPHFAHEQGAAHFAAVHKVFGASNVSKLLAHLPVSRRCEAAVTISYEAQARLQDPVYGCVAHIFALQRQVMSLRAQLEACKAQADAQMQQKGSIQNNETELGFVEQSGSQPWLEDYGFRAEGCASGFMAEVSGWRSSYQDMEELESVALSYLYN